MSKLVAYIDRRGGKALIYKEPADENPHPIYRLESFAICPEPTGEGFHSRMYMQDAELELQKVDEEYPFPKLHTYLRLTKNQEDALLHTLISADQDISLELRKEFATNVLRVVEENTEVKMWLIHKFREIPWPSRSFPPIEELKDLVQRKGEKLRLIKQGHSKAESWFEENQGKIFTAFQHRPSGWDVDMEPCGHPGEWGFLSSEEVEIVTD